MQPHADQFATLGEDLVLLSIDPRTGRVTTAEKIPYGLMGSELVRLAATGRVDITGDRIVVRSPAPTGDPELDQALASIAQSRKPPRPRTWVGHPRRHIRDEYLARLVRAGALREETSAILGRRRHAITAPAAVRLTAARALLDTIARSDGQVPPTQAAFAGLAHAIGLDARLYPRWADRPLRRRLAQIAKGRHTAPAPAGPAITSATSAAGAAATTNAAARAATAASMAAVQAATDAAVAAAVQSATDAAVASAVAAASAASTAAATHHGGASGGHH
jgi:Golgi phosphoprotein 3 (GPP34)